MLEYQHSRPVHALISCLPANERLKKFSAEEPHIKSPNCSNRVDRFAELQPTR